MASILLKNLTISDKLQDVLISDGLIQKIEPAGSSLGWDLAGDIEVMDCTRKTAVPGFVNMHAHAAMTLMRGVGEDMVFQDWLARIWEIEKDVDAEYVYWGTRVACLEMARTGTTCVNDHYWYHDAGHQALMDAGIRPVVSYVICDRLDPSEWDRQKEQCEKMYEMSRSWPAPSQFVVGPHAIYSVSRHMLEWTRDFAEKHDLRIQIHLSETEKEVIDCKQEHGGLSPVEYLDELGMLNDRLLAAHTLWIDEHDIELLGNAHVNCVHNVNSNLKLASGYKFKYNELRDAGANVCIGTDGCASSNNLDMLEAMKTSAILQKAWRRSPEAMPLNELMDCATANGARALGINAGRIKEGALADLSIIDTDNSFFLSPGSFVANFIYSSHSDCIDSVICNGRFIMKNREIKGEKETLAEARKVINKLKV